MQMNPPAPTTVVSTLSGLLLPEFQVASGVAFSVKRPLSDREASLKLNIIVFGQTISSPFGRGERKDKSPVERPLWRVCRFKRERA